MIPGTITEVRPEAQYQGTVYSNRVVIELDDGETVELFDGTVPVTSADVVGDHCELEVTALPPESLATAPDGATPGIAPCDEMVTLTGRFVGDVPGNGQDSPSLELDVGYGTLGVTMTPDDWETVADLAVETGDLVTIKSVRLDVTDIRTP